jgi:hypothetical protein
MTSLFRKFTWWLQRRGKEDELREELQFDLTEEAAERHADGLSEEQVRCSRLSFEALTTSFVKGEVFIWRG